MAEPKIYPKGLSFFAPRVGAPDFIKGSLIISPNDLFAWLKENPSLITEHEKYGKQIKFTLTDKGLSVDTWKPEANTSASNKGSSDVPF